MHHMNAMFVRTKGFFDEFNFNGFGIYKTEARRRGERTIAFQTKITAKVYAQLCIWACLVAYRVKRVLVFFVPFLNRKWH